MSHDEVKRAYRAYVEALNSPDPVVFDDVLDPNFKDVVMGVERTPELVKRTSRAIHTVFEDFRVTVDDIIAEGDRVASRLHYRARHRRTGKQVSFIGLTFSRVVGGRVTGGAGLLDLQSLQAQLGPDVPVFEELSAEMAKTEPVS